MDFQRARSDDQREQRRQAILATTAEMLTEMTVSELSFNELSRRVGLAKSNITRYFPSREAILLELLDQETRDWARVVSASMEPHDGEVYDRVDSIAAALASSLSARPVLCDLVSSQNSVLEHNITTEVALQHKRAIAAALTEVITAVHRCLPELTVEETHEGVAFGLFLIGAAWPHSQPSEALQAAYDSDPDIAAGFSPFEPLIRRGFSLALSGLVARSTRTRLHP